MASNVPAIGIDLGTTYSCVAVHFNGKVHIVPNHDDAGDYITPSYVLFDSGEEVIGKQAKQNAFRNPQNTIYDVKRILGRTFTDPILQNDMAYWPFTVQEDEGVPKVKVNGKLLHPEQISAKLLARLSATADDFLGLPRGTVKKAVITVPAYFNDGQRQATVDAGELAGLEVLTILNEPTAAAIAYSMKMDSNSGVKRVLVFDLGGGTFDVAVLKMQQSKVNVLGVNGDTHLGGEDFDRNLMEYCAAQLKKETGMDLLKDKLSSNTKVREKAQRNLRRLQTSCENAKQFLSVGVKAKVVVDAIVNGEDLIVDITREKFVELNMPLFKTTIDLVDETLKELKLTKEGIDEIVLVGGSTRIPKIQELLTNYFNGKMLNKSTHPDQAVAHGAAIKAAMMTNSIHDMKLNEIEDVTAMSIGIEDGKNMKLGVSLPKNTKIPARKITEWKTIEDFQTSALFSIYQGEDFAVAANNTLLGEFILKGIPSKKEGEEPMDVSMEINEMGILHVEAVCRSSKSRNSITIVESKGRMSTTLKNSLKADMKKSVSEAPRK